jgi:galactose-1-phosphate uridylyltransferase
MIVFEKRSIPAKIKNPKLKFAVEEQEIEFRKDPLTGRWCRINVNRVKRFQQKPEEGLKELVNSTKSTCPFCQKNIESSASRFVELEEKIKVGESVLFPNLYPYSAYHGVLVFTTKKHFIGLNEFTPRLLYDAFKNCVNFFKLVNKKRPQLKFPTINFNFMPPAAASILHPHLQTLLDDRPTYYTSMQVRNSLAYYKRKKSNYWSDLVEIEKQLNERYIGRTGAFSWIADFAPIKNNDVSGIMTEGISTLTDLTAGDMKDLSNGLSKIFNGLWRNGVRSLTMAIFSGPIDEDLSRYFSVNLKIVSRPNFTPNYVSDIGFMEFLHQECVAETLPEDVAKSLKFVKRK